jgi:hypothetical protein
MNALPIKNLLDSLRYLSMKKLQAVLLLILIIFLPSLSGCDHSTENPSKNSDQSELDTNRDLWNESGISTYTYTYTRSCFCLPQEDIVVVVKAGNISEAFYTPSGTYLSGDELAQLYTIKELFDLVQEAINSNVAVLKVTYNSTYGFPEAIYIDRDERIADEEIGHYVTDFR